MSQPHLLAPQSPPQAPKTKKKKAKHDPTYLGPLDSIGEGDTRIVHDILPLEEADEVFEKLRKEVAWQKMYHRTGEVPRLVAVQGIISSTGSIPIYRHPADESPPLLQYDSTVNFLRHQCEKLVSHELNHVLIQYYRHGEDNISEHSDKTLDITRGSSIVNLSMGAMRTMTLRAKRSSSTPAVGITPVSSATGNLDASTQQLQTQSSEIHGLPRTTQRIRLPHNSLFILGQRTNANYSHAIRADKRPNVEKSNEELAFNGERISLTFRHINTFIDPSKGLIWGQGATAKTMEEATPILQGKVAKVAGEQMIIGFGKENHMNETEFEWENVYGCGFDVVNFEVKTDNEPG